MERLERYTTASDFFQADKTRTECIADAKSVQDELDALQAEQEEYLSVANGQNSQIEELTQSKEQEMGSEFKEIEQQVTEKSKKMVRASRPRWIKCPRSHVYPHLSQHEQPRGGGCGKQTDDGRHAQRCGDRWPAHGMRPARVRR